MKKIALMLICSCILLISLTGCQNAESKNINDKLNSELEYIEDLIFKIAIKHAKGEYIEDDKIKWDDIKRDVSKINDSADTLILDLTEVNVDNKDIIGFSNDLNDLLISISNESQTTILEKLNDMYAKIIIFRQAYLEDKNKIEKNKIKNEVLNIYSLATKNDFIGASTKITETIENYKNLMNNKDYAEENGYNLNKIYILLEEYRNSINTQNYDLIRMKYIITVENL